MGSETEPELISSTPRLQLFCNTNTLTLKKSPPRSGTLTPPLYSSAAVPFRWEEEPGKPRGGGSTSFNALSSINPQIDDLTPKCLELPPRLLALDSANFSKLNSPTTVLDGPYTGRPRIQSSSFRIIRKECYGYGYGSFRRRSFSPEREQLSSLVASGRLSKDRSFLGSWRWGKGKSKREVVGLGPSYVFPNDSSIDKELEEKEEDSNQEEEEETSCNVKITRVRQSGSVSSYTRSRFWATMYKGLKQVVPWKNRKQKKDGFVI